MVRASLTLKFLKQPPQPSGPGTLYKKKRIPCPKEFHQHNTDASVSRRVRVNVNTPHGYRDVLGLGIIGISISKDIREDGLWTCMSVSQCKIDLPKSHTRNSFRALHSASVNFVVNVL
jgi:hypothetical protein